MIVIGDPLLQQPTGVMKDANGGFRTVYIYKGIRSLAEPLFQQWSEQYDTVEIIPIDGDLVEVRASNQGNEDGQQQTAVVTIEIRSSLVTQSIELSPFFAGLSEKSLYHVNRVLSDQTSSDSTYDPAQEITNSVAAAELDLAWYLYQLKLKGQTDYEAPAHYVTRTLSVSAGYPTWINTTNLNKLWTASDLSNYLNAPTYFNIGTLTPTAGQTALGLAFRWKQQEANANIVSSGGWQLVEGWQSGFWNTYLYDAAT